MIQHVEIATFNAELYENDLKKVFLCPKPTLGWVAKQKYLACFQTKKNRFLFD